MGWVRKYKTLKTAPGMVPKIQLCLGGDKCLRISVYCHSKTRPMIQKFNKLKTNLFTKICVKLIKKFNVKFLFLRGFFRIIIFY